ncbi:uncharacterized protein [Periplaneta americana]|uniref:uncharacterized protein isoform X1 n=1 Tax=Periplaneta americana TaxID=6978 RepID=UPI0037E93506
MSYYSEEYVNQGKAFTSEVEVEEDPMPISFPVVKRESQERNLLYQNATRIKGEHVDQSHDLTSEVKSEEDPEAISFPVMKREPEEQNLLTCVKEEYAEHSRGLKFKVKSEKDSEPISFPVVKRESEERNFLNLHVTGRKKENVNQSPDLTSEIKLEKDPEPISFPVVKREPEEEQIDSHTVNEEPRAEVTAQDNEVLTERIAATNERNVSSEFDSLLLEDNEIVCEIRKNSGSSGKPSRTREDGKKYESESSKISVSNSANLSGHSPKDAGKKPFKCDVCNKFFKVKLPKNS